MYRQAAVRPPEPARAALRRGRHAPTARRIAADRFVFACGPWLGRLFPELLGRRIFPTRQEVFFFAPEPGDERYQPGRLPGWADFNGGDIYYGFPDLEGRGFKIAHDAHGAADGPGHGRPDLLGRGAGGRARLHGAPLPARSPTGRSARRASASMRTARTAIS